VRQLTVRHITPVALFLFAYMGVSLLGPSGFALTAISDIAGTTLWLIAIAAMSWAAFSNQGRTRWFWILLAASATLVCANLGAWLYYDVAIAKPVPDPFWADIPLFLQPVPIMAAAAMRPGTSQRGQKFRLSTLNFLILLLWWVYIYALLVFPNEYVVPNKTFFDSYYNFLFVVEFEALLAILGGLAVVTQGIWRRIYWELFGAGALYLVAFTLLNAALIRGDYYGGSLYDVPAYASICWFIVIALRSRTLPREQVVAIEPQRLRDLSGTFAALAVLSMPVIGLAELFLNPQARQLLVFRISVTLAGILAVAVCVFLRQRLLSREMELLLHESKQNLEQLKKAQTHLVQKERLAGIGQLVAGVAHELNNPLTAVMGYSDLLTEEATDNARKRLEKLGTEVRRMKRILENLASFAQPRGGKRTWIDTEKLVRDCLLLFEYQFRKCGATVHLNFAPDVPRIVGNEGELKQVFVNLFTNCARALEQAQEKIVHIEARLQEGKVVLRVSDSGPGFVDLDRAFDPFYTTMPVGQGTGLGLSVCYGTIQEHDGRIFAQNLHPTGAAVTIELPANTRNGYGELQKDFLDAPDSHYASKARL
jgi:signal transduction histidine kinase